MLVPYVTLENFFSNFSFILLFISMLFYWVQTGFMYEAHNKTSDCSVITLHTRSMRGSMRADYSVDQKHENPNAWSGASVTILLANFSLFSLLVLRWKESGHFPLSNLYESLMFLSWSFTTIQLILENITKQKSQPPYIGCITSPSALFTNAFATFSLPIEMQKSSSLVPALQSNWLMMHVTVMILSYAALICGSLLSIAFLIITKDVDDKQFTDSISDAAYFIKKNTSNSPENNLLNTYEESNIGAYASLENSLRDKIYLEQNGLVSDSISSVANANMRVMEGNTFSFVFENFANKYSSPNNHAFSEVSTIQQQSRKIKLANSLDNLSYRILGLGFPLLTIGILSGAVWANEAWGSYWSWDPKETWAFLTWLVFAIYLHTRLTKGWQGKRPAIIASLGFMTVWICFLGVNLIGEGLHSYGWIHSS
uniref:Cytochrome c biogenesis protein CcsA n=1 Tax=Bracteacoccus giganteus TaxID=50039 RepID=A0A0S2LQ44_9CHLO|nr:heme attachment to plastid cytochrome c [Bracteacoccus giganteus]ALO63492.1 heme attachment to plastid cytochrome c [Bracteacoccus giganteus]